MNTTLDTILNMSDDAISAEVRLLCSWIGLADPVEAIEMMDQINDLDDDGNPKLEWCVVRILEELAELLFIELEPNPLEDDIVVNKLFPPDPSILLVQMDRRELAAA